MVPPFQGEENPLTRRRRRKSTVATNSDMRLVIAGAGGRMGRTLIHAIAVTKGVTLAGAVEAAGSRLTRYA